METIFALASARGKAGIAVIRISGPQAVAVGTSIAGKLPAPGRSGLRKLRDAGGGLLDEALVLNFAAGHSFTGEDIVEFQVHGSVATVAAVLSVLGEHPATRLAEPGEFTRRALENERLDLSQVEGLADLVEAETEAQRKQALRVLSGELGTRVAEWRRDLIRAAALLEATIDFADEDVPVDVTGEVLELVLRTEAALTRELAGTDAAERVRDGFEVAIIGPPNAGKSSLLNVLAGRDAAITSQVAGTTRDVIEVRMDIAGFAVTLLDTAGLRETEDQVERLGIQRAQDRARTADLRIILLPEPKAEPILTPKVGDLVVLAKRDLWPEAAAGLSSKTGEGITTLIAEIADRLSERAAPAGLAIRQRHAVALRESIEELRKAGYVMALGPDHAELAAEDIRAASRRLASLIGHVGVENLLDEIFASFCLGK